MTGAALEPRPREPVELFDRQAGELVDITTATDTRLAELVDAINELRAALSDEEAAVSSELLQRLDAVGVYTRHVGEPKRGWTIKAPSKQVGTTTVDAKLLRQQLLALLTPVGAGEPLIAAELARAALRRRAVITVTVDMGTDLDALQATIQDGLTQIGGVPVYDVAVVVTEAVADAGVKRLERAGHADAVTAATVAVPAPPRRATVKRKTVI